MNAAFSVLEQSAGSGSSNKKCLQPYGDAGREAKQRFILKCYVYSSQRSACYYKRSNLSPRI